MLPFVVEIGVDLVCNDNEVMLASNLCQFLQLLCIVSGSSRVVGVIHDHIFISSFGVFDVPLANLV